MQLLLFCSKVQAFGEIKVSLKTRIKANMLGAVATSYLKNEKG